MTTTLERSGIADLRRQFRGPLVQPGEPDYEDTRKIWNAAIERRPALIARCTDRRDVLAAVRFAREHGLLTSIRGAGHNVSGSALCDGGVTVDLSLLRAVTIDTDRRIATVEPGVRLGELDRATQVFGLAAPAGINSVTGVAGLTLGGGIGWLMRAHGLTSDNLVGAEVVTADGEVVRASEEEHPGLLWALRGGGGNFGVVMSFEFRLVEAGPQVAAGGCYRQRYLSMDAPELAGLFRHGLEFGGCKRAIAALTPTWSCRGPRERRAGNRNSCMREVSGACDGRAEHLSLTARS